MYDEIPLAVLAVLFVNLSLEFTKRAAKTARGEGYVVCNVLVYLTPTRLELVFPA